jgi:hypothetical protein
MSACWHTQLHALSKGIVATFQAISSACMEHADLCRHHWYFHCLHINTRALSVLELGPGLLNPACPSMFECLLSLVVTIIVSVSAMVPSLTTAGGAVTGKSRGLALIMK